MPFYDFYQHTQRPTALGQRWMKQAAWHVLEQASLAATSLRKVVEIGPGWGSFAQLCGEKHIDYVAIDANFGLLQYIKPHYGMCALVPPLPVCDEACDLIIASHVFEHCAGLESAQLLLSEMYRVVRPEGCIVIRSPDLLWTGKYFWDCDYSHNFPISSRRLFHMFIDQGLEIVTLQYTYNHFTGWKGFLAGQIVRLIPYRFVASSPTSNLYSERLYRLRLTFARSVLIIGRRPNNK